MLPAPIISPSFTSQAAQLLQRVQRGISPVELIYTAHEHWPFQPGQTTHTHPTLRISVLDSSFNPPTLAHLALANSSPPPPSPPTSPHAAPISTEQYDARILLLSVRNADKILMPGDASFVQRLEMMRLLSYDIQPTNTTGSRSEASCMSGNVAIAAIDEPTFVGKSTVLLHFLQARLAAFYKLHSPDSMSGRKSILHTMLPVLKLTFLLGFDTLLRLFSPKYYPSDQAMIQQLGTLLSPDQEDCRIVCAYRSPSGSKTSQQTRYDSSSTQQFITSGRIAFIDIGAEEQTYSSSEVRTGVMAGDESWNKLVTNTIAEYIVNQGLYSH